MVEADLLGVVMQTAWVRVKRSMRTGQSSTRVKAINNVEGVRGRETKVKKESVDSDRKQERDDREKETERRIGRRGHSWNRSVPALPDSVLR